MADDTEGHAEKATACVERVVDEFEKGRVLQRGDIIERLQRLLLIFQAPMALHHCMTGDSSRSP